MIELLDKSAKDGTLNFKSLILLINENVLCLIDALLKSKESALLIGIQGNQVVLTPIIELKDKILKYSS